MERSITHEKEITEGREAGSWSLLLFQFRESFAPLSKHVGVHMWTPCIAHFGKLAWTYSIMYQTFRYLKEWNMKRVHWYLEHKFQGLQMLHSSNQMSSSTCLASWCSTSQIPGEIYAFRKTESEFLENFWFEFSCSSDTWWNYFKIIIIEQCKSGWFARFKQSNGKLKLGT